MSVSSMHSNLNSVDMNAHTHMISVKEDQHGTRHEVYEQSECPNLGELVVDSGGRPR